MIITNAKVFIDGEFYDNLDVRYDKEKIQEIGKNLKDDVVIDAKGNYLYPGGVETHIHGGFTYGFYNKNKMIDFSDGEKNVREICKRLPQYGVTSCLPTIGADAPFEDLNYAVRSIRKARQDIEGADPFKIHFEGPYTNPIIKCSFDPKYSVLPSKEHTLAMCDNDLSDVILMCVAPEMEGAMDYISWATSQNIQVEVCYTNATSEQIFEAADRGATQTSHFYNGFEAMHHRKNSAVAGCLLDDRYHFQLTLDGLHVLKPWIKLAVKCKGIDNVYGITDMGFPCGLPDGDYDNHYFGKLHIRNGHNVTEDGTIAGSGYTWDRMMRSARDVYDFTMEEVAKIYFENPCKCLGVTDRGKIEVGRRSDFVIMDKDYHVIKTLIKGEVYYENNEF